jgi:hypothetical protein
VSRVLAANAELAPLVRTKSENFTFRRQQNCVVTAHRHLSHLASHTEYPWYSKHSLLFLPATTTLQRPKILAQCKHSPIWRATERHPPIRHNLLHVRIQHAHHDRGLGVLHYSFVLQLLLRLNPLQLVSRRPLSEQCVRPLGQQGLEVDQVVVGLCVLL